MNETETICCTACPMCGAPAQAIKRPQDERTWYRWVDLSGSEENNEKNAGEAVAMRIVDVNGVPQTDWTDYHPEHIPITLSEEYVQYAYTRPAHAVAYRGGLDALALEAARDIMRLDIPRDVQRQARIQNIVRATLDVALSYAAPAQAVSEPDASALQDIRLKFKSGNSVPVESIRIIRQQWDAIERMLAAAILAARKEKNDE